MILTLDLGTTYFKAAIFDRAGQVVALHRAAPPIVRPRPGHCVLDAADFRVAVRGAVAELGKQAPRALRDVAAISFATQTNSFVLLDAADEPITPILIWADERAAEFEPAVQRIAAETPGFRATTGVPLLGTIFMAAKLLWLQRYEPGVWSRVRRVCLLSDYLTHWLTGEHVTEAGAAGLTGAVDIHRFCWWPAVCEPLGLDAAWLPAVVRAGTDVGVLRPEAACALGVPRTCRFVVGCLDQYAGAIGAGNIEPGLISETTGTVLATVRCSQGFEPDLHPDVFQGPAFDPGLYYRMAFGSTSANLLEWFRNRQPDAPRFDRLVRQASASAPGADGLMAHPRADLLGLENGFVGHKDTMSRGHYVRAILEAVAYALADQVDRLCAGDRPLAIRSCGGAAASEEWCGIKANVLNVELAVSACPEPTSLGAAMLAARALGRGSLGDLSRKWVTLSRSSNPHAPTHAEYVKLCARYKKQFNIE